MSSDNQNMELVDKGWENMQPILDQEMPEDDKGILPFWWIVAGVLLLLLGSSVFWISDQKTKQSVEKNDEVAQQNVTKGPQQNNARTVITQIDPSDKSISDKEHISHDRLSLTSNSSSHDKSPQVHQQLVKNTNKQTKNTNARDISIKTDERSVQIKLIDPLKQRSIKSLVFTPTLELGSKGFDLIELQGTSKSSNSLFVRLISTTNLTDNFGIQLDGGWHYNLGGKWSASSSLGYQYSYTGRNSVYNVNFNAQGEVVNSPEPNELYDNSDQQLSYDNFTQQLMILTQTIEYKLSPKWSAYGGGQLGYALNSSSRSRLVASYPVVYDDNTIELRQTNISSDQLVHYTSKWYYGARLGAQYRLNNDFLFQAGFSSMQAMQPELDRLNLDETRRFLVDLGVIWMI